MKSNRKRQIHPAVGAISARGVRGRGVEGEGSAASEVEFY